MARSKYSISLNLVSYIFGVLGAAVILTYSAAVFFLGITPEIVPKFLYKFSNLLIFLRYSFIITSSALVLYYAFFLLSGKSDGKIITLSVLNIIIAVTGLIFSPNVEAVFLFTSIDGLMASMFIESCCYFKYDHLGSATKKISARILTIKVLAFSVAILFAIAIFTYFGYTRTVVYMMTKYRMTFFLSDALGFFLFMLSPTILILTFSLVLSMDVSLVRIYRARKKKLQGNNANKDEYDDDDYDE